MSRHRPPQHHLRLVVPTVEQDDDRTVITPVPAEPTGAVIATHVEPYIRCGRHVIAAATAAIVDAAAEYRLEGGPWEPDAVRAEIGEIVTRKLYETIVSHITQSGANGETVADRCKPADDRHD